MLLRDNYLSGGQICLNNPNVNRRGQVTIAGGRQVIVPNARFNCNGRITSVAVSMESVLDATNYPIFQVWNPTATSFQSNNYSKIGEVQLSDGSLKDVGQESYYYVNISLNSSSRIEFQLGGVIGYYQPSHPQRRIWSIQTSGYISYSNTVTSPSTTIDIKHVDNTENDRQPLIKVMFGKVMINATQVILPGFTMYVYEQLIVNMYSASFTAQNIS